MFKRAVPYANDALNLCGDPAQEGCFFDVNDVGAAHSEIRDASGSPGIIDIQKINGKSYRAFFVVAPDDPCYMIAERVD